jgi:hypothetical protein
MIVELSVDADASSFDGSRRTGFKRAMVPRLQESASPSLPFV